MHFNQTCVQHTVLYQFQMPLEDVSEKNELFLNDKSKGREDFVFEIVRWPLSYQLTSTAKSD